MAKKVQSYVKLHIAAGMANPSPPVGPALGQRGVNIMEFCKAFNSKTATMEKGLPIPSFSKGDSNLRSFLSYEFLYSAIKMALRLEYKLPNKVFNLSNTHPISTNELFRVIGLSFNKNARIVYFPNSLFQAMIKVNRLQLILCNLFGNFNMSNAKLLKEFDLKG